MKENGNNPTTTLEPQVQEEADSPYAIPPEVIPDIDNLVLEDGKPVENRFIEKLMRLLTEPLYVCWPGPGEGRTFQVMANVGLYYARSSPALVPDVMLILDLPVNVDLLVKENRSFFTWVAGKVPEVVIEVVSDRRGGEASNKMRDYARIGVSYYVIFDPAEYLEAGVLRIFALQPERTYRLLESGWLEGVGLGLTLWDGVFEGQEARWLRWCNKQGQVIPTGQERVERLEAQLRALGQEPTT